MYELYAILSHSGTALGGHYYAYPCLPGFPPPARARPQLLFIGEPVPAAAATLLTVSL
jgi:hypothetical protein